MGPALRRRRFLTLLAPLLTGSALAAPRPDRGLVYEASRGGARCWLGGSLHRLRREDHPLPPAYERAYTRCSRVFFETHPGEVGSGGFRRKLEDLRTLPDGKTLEKTISADLWKETLRTGKRLDIPESELRTLRPWFAAWRITERAYESRGILTFFGMEEYFSRQAARDAKPLDGLDTAQKLLGHVKEAALAPEEEERALRDSLRAEKELDALFRQMLEVWRAGDETRITAMFQESLPQDSKSRKSLMSDRNEAWARRIHKNPKDFDNAFLLPGIGHLPGRGGLARGLADLGWSVTRL